MTKNRAKELADEVYKFIFQLLDNEPEFNGYEAGEIGWEIEQRFREQIEPYVEE